MATVTGFPVSTTHALTGAMLGSGWIAVGTQVDLSVLGEVFLLPLLVSPLLAVLLGAGLYRLLRWWRLRLGITKEWCLCIGEEQSTGLMPRPANAIALQSAVPVVSIRVAEPSACSERYAGRFLGIGSQPLIDAVHFLSAGIVSFARGLNDTPKIAALLLVFPALGTDVSLLAVAIAIAIGGLLSARRVAETMSHRITAINHGQGLAANLSTGALVTIASLLGLPVSTTHVSVGALFGIGLTNRQVNPKVVHSIVWSWLITLPCAALIGAAVYAWVGL
jgi:PiT family inorganic phosphate transporter